MAKMIDVTPRRLAQLAAQGIVPRERRGRYHPVKVVQGYIRFLRDRTPMESVGAEKMQSAKLRKVEASARREELALLREERELVPIESVKSVWTRIAGDLRNRINNSDLRPDQKRDFLRPIYQIRDEEYYKGNDRSGRN